MIVSGLWHKSAGSYAPGANTATRRSLRYGIVTRGLIVAASTVRAEIIRLNSPITQVVSLVSKL